MNKEIDVYDYMNVIMKQLKKGVLITTKKDDKVNTMSISWGKIGIEWNKLIFGTYVRFSRFTHEMLESGEFTINIALEGEDVSKVIAHCGTKSGRDTDKFADLGLTLSEPMNISTPGIKQLPLTLECKVIYRQPQDETAIPQDIKDGFYKNGNFHEMFYGEIVGAYIAE